MECHCHDPCRTTKKAYDLGAYEKICVSKIVNILEIGYKDGIYRFMNERMSTIEKYHKAMKYTRPGWITSSME